MLSTNITKQEIVHYLVLDKEFSTESQAKKYVETIETYNQKYLSTDDPVKSLLKLIEDEIKPNSSFYCHIVLAGLYNNISSKTPYIDNSRIYECILNLCSWKREIIFKVYNELIGEYIKKYGYDKNNSE